MQTLLIIKNNYDENWRRIWCEKATCDVDHALLITSYRYFVTMGLELNN